MEHLAAGEVERVMRVQEVMLRAIAKKITWWEAAEILGGERCGDGSSGMKSMGFGSCSGRKGKPNWKKAPAAEVERVLALYREQYYDLNVRHFHEKLAEQHQIHCWLRSSLWSRSELLYAIVAFLNCRGVRKISPPPHATRSADDATALRCHRESSVQYTCGSIRVGNPDVPHTRPAWSAGLRGDRALDLCRGYRRDVHRRRLTVPAFKCNLCSRQETRARDDDIACCAGLHRVGVDACHGDVHGRWRR
jgi:hypothetical protein